MKTYRQREKQGNKIQESTKGPDEVKIKVKKKLSSIPIVKHPELQSCMKYTEWEIDTNQMLLNVVCEW